MLDIEAELKKSDQNLVWLDCEMTGLDPDKERIIEIAVIVTGPQLTPRIEGPVLAIHQSDELLNQMDNWNRGTHGRSGLIDKVKASTITELDAEVKILAFLTKYLPKGTSPLCGNTISQDRRFLVKYMPRLEAFCTIAILMSVHLRSLQSAGGPTFTALSRSGKAIRRWPMCMSRLTNWSTIGNTF